MKVKSIIVGLAILGLGGLAAPVRAQTGQNCWVDNRTNVVVCEHQDRRDDCSYPENRRYNDPYAEIKINITAIYRQVLGRDPDPAGLRSYTERLLRDWDYSQVRQSLARSHEASQRINQLYLEILGRNADPEGLRTYQKHLETGWTLNQVREELIRSPEARSRNQR